MGGNNVYLLATKSTVEMHRLFLPSNVARLLILGDFHRSLLSSRQNSFSTSAAACKTHVTMNDSYRDHSIHQYDAHRMCQHLLEGSLDRFQDRIFLSKHVSSFYDQRSRYHWVDLGSADGTNTMKTLRWAVWYVQQQQRFHPRDKPLHVTFEDHPTSNEDTLRSTLTAHEDWFRDHNVEYSISMKSFYEPLFDPESVDLFMSYICLHWLNTNDTFHVEGDGDERNLTLRTTSLRKWKHPSVSLSKDGKAENIATRTVAPCKTPFPCDFTFMNERTTPFILQEEYAALAKRHLAKFLALRARELKPGAEMVLVMVSQPNDFVAPRHQQDSSPSILTTAMQNCIKCGLLRESVLQETIVPYYLRTHHDIYESLQLAATLEVGGEDCLRPGALLQLVGDVESYTVRIARNEAGSSDIEDCANIFWSIHSNAVKGAGANQNEMKAIQSEVNTLFHETFSFSNDHVDVTYLACVIRRRTREAWSGKEL
jgi:hypothetical protein